MDKINMKKKNLWMDMLSDKEKEMLKLRKKIVEIIADNFDFYFGREIEFWSIDEIKRAIAYIDSNNFTDENFFEEIYDLAEIVASDIETQM